MKTLVIALLFLSTAFAQTVTTTTHCDEELVRRSHFHGLMQQFLDEDAKGSR